SSISQTGTFASGKRVEFTYDSDVYRATGIGRFASETGGNAIVSTVITYNSRNLVETLTHTSSGPAGTVNSYRYDYDANAFLSERQDSDGTATFDYDVNLQTVSVSYTHPLLRDESYNYDDAGNPTSSSLVGAIDVGQSNRVMADETYTYEYDDEGNLTRMTSLFDGSSREYVWDFRNRLVEVIFHWGDGTIVRRVQHEYDALNRRVATVDADIDGGESTNQAAVTYYVYDRENVILDLVDADGRTGLGNAAPARAYLHGIGVDEIYAQDNGNGDVLWLLADAQGTIRDVVNNEGEFFDHFLVDSKGNIEGRPLESLPTRYVYAGREWDGATELYYNRARYLDPRLGRFISADPSGFASGDYNFYRYANNNGANFRDPSGLAYIGNPPDYLRRIVDADAAGRREQWARFFSLGSTGGREAAFNRFDRAQNGGLLGQARNAFEWGVGTATGIVLAVPTLLKGIFWDTIALGLVDVGHLWAGMFGEARDR
ncbi:MAG: RHS repeat-associated core domain-containing protein, partial [Verrucomicrobiae bacterium]|nr:RHS repeat-associated core domain-containing protein [Verrucomicrobiae bacterium]